MPRTYHPVVGPTRRHKYTDANMQRAVDAVASGTSQRDAARMFGVPRATLIDRIKNRHQRISGGQPVFSDEEECVIAKNVATLGDWGFPVDMLDLRLLVKNYLEARGRTVRKFRNNLPGPDWLKSFMQRRRAIITPRLCQNICRKRAEITPGNIDNYFENLRVTIENVPPENIINYDETNLSDNPGQKKCVFRRGCRYPERVVNSTKSAVSVMFACSASGVLLQPYVVYKAEHLHDRWIQGGPDGVPY